MGTVHHFTDRIKAFEAFTLERRARSRNRNQNPTIYREKESERRSTPHTRDDSTGPSLPIVEDSATSVVHLDASASDAAYPSHASSQSGVNVVHGPIPLRPAAVSAHSTFDPSASPLVPSPRVRQQNPLSTLTPPSPLFNAKPTSHALQTPGDSGPSIPIVGGSARKVVHVSEAAHSSHHPAHGGVDIAQGLRPPPSAVVLPHSTWDPSASPSVPPAQVRLQDPPSTPTTPPPLFGARSTSHALQPPDQNARSRSSGPSLSNTPAHRPHAAYGAANFFSNANGFSVGQMNNNVHNFGSSKTVFEYLEPHVSHGAAHNSGERSDAPACAPETRVAVQEDVVSWMRDGDEDKDPKQIMWLSGPAGSGKTAIAGSVAETCRKEGLLAATFFISSFSGSADRHSKRCIVATLARHLAGHRALHGYKVQLLASIEREPDIFHKRLSEQAEHLLIEPFRAVQEQGDGPAWPKGIMLDGLDEVLAERRPDRTPEDLEWAHEEDQLEILNVLLTLANNPTFPFRIFVASRPERVISEFFATTAKATTLTLFLDAKYKPDVDIARFLWSKFAGIRRRYRISNSSWPGQEAVDRMVEMSSGQFIVPATIVRHIEAGVPQRQLDDILQLKWEDAGRKNPFAIVDALYSCILRRSPEPLLAATWLRIRTAAQDPIPALYFQQLMEDFEGEFHHVLGPLSSLISIPMTGDNEAPLTVYHKSLGEYLSSQHRSSDLYLSTSSVQAFIAARCVRVLKNKGPAVPFLHSSKDWGQFFDMFYDSTLIKALSVGDPKHYNVTLPILYASTSFKAWLVTLSEQPLQSERCTNKVRGSWTDGAPPPSI